MTRSITLHVTGMHCRACVTLTEEAAKELPYVTNARGNLARQTISLEGDLDSLDPEKVALELTRLLEPHGYRASVEKPVRERGWSDFKLAVPITLALLAGFLILQRLGVVNLVGGGAVTYGTAFFIGVIASLSSCMAVVGGLVLSMSATFAKSGDRLRPQAMFHIGRLVSFLVLGGAIGAIGSAFVLGPAATFVLGLLVALVMLILGVNLLGVFHWSKRLQPAMPRFIARRVLKTTELTHILTPLLAGAATFFLPCGFTQSMQIYTLTTGSFLEGALTMGAFALGTLPVLALVSFSSFSVGKGRRAGVFFKTAGLVVIAFAVFNLLNSLAAIGLLPPLFNL